MKKIRKILVAVLVLMLMLTPVVSVSQPVTVQAAAKTTKTTEEIRRQILRLRKWQETS